MHVVAAVIGRLTIEVLYSLDLTRGRPMNVPTESVTLLENVTTEA